MTGPSPSDLDGCRGIILAGVFGTLLGLVIVAVVLAIVVD